MVPNEEPTLNKYRHYYRAVGTSGTRAPSGPQDPPSLCLHSFPSASMLHFFFSVCWLPHHFHICSSSPCKETGLSLSVPNPKSQGRVILLSSHPPMKHGQENIVELYKMAAPSAMIWIYVLEKSRQLPKFHRSRMTVSQLTP